jgi:hypothetical protein
MRKDWEEFAVGKIDVKSQNSNVECLSFTKITHVTHIDAFFNVLNDCKISPRLVYDESILNDKRILVVWLSPNYWTKGFRYGTVQLSFDWNKLIDGKNYYWIECIDYQVKAVRILITDQDRSAEFTKYDPTLGNGPWWFDIENKTHYYNGKYCLEIMIERSIAISEVLDFEFVKHHGEYCNIYPTSPSKCKELGQITSKTSFLVVSKILKRGIELQYDELLKTQLDLFNDDNILFYGVEYVYSRFKNIKNYKGSITNQDDEAIPLFISIMDYISQEDKKSYEALIKLYSSIDEIVKIFFIQMGKCFNLNTNELNNLKKKIEAKY